MCIIVHEPAQRVCGLIFLLIVVFACTPENRLRPFSSDGCSLFPDSSPISKKDWCSCCFAHDLSYWRGGTAEEREAADALLKECVFEKTGDESFSKLMYAGVRAGGSPYFYNWYRWGYGWGFDRKYQALTDEESEVADGLVQQYFDASDGLFCQSK
jgi:hypothetical protein